MFTGPQHTLTVRSNLRFPQTMPADGELQFPLPGALNIPLIAHHGKANEIIGKVNGADQLRNAVNQLHTRLYAA